MELIGSILRALAKLPTGIVIAWVVLAIMVIILLVISVIIIAKERESTLSESGPTLELPSEGADGQPEDVDGKWTFREIVGVDSEGRTTNFSIAILSQEFNWSFQSDKTIELNGKPVDIMPHLFSRGIQHHFDKALDLIVVGVASQEVARSDQQGIIEEEARARRRARQLLVWVREALVSDVELYTLNLGYYRESGGIGWEETAGQRRVIIISVKRKDEGVDLSGALRDALLRREFRIDWGKYSLFNSFLVELEN